jgi:leucyl/phenylalanyl-tRNA--protein transferase
MEIPALRRRRGALIRFRKKEKEMPNQEKEERRSSSPQSSSKLTWELLYLAYVQGLFPMDNEGEVSWYSPDPRAILEWDSFHIPQTLKGVLRKNPFEIRQNTAFKAVMQACQASRQRTWISNEFITAYTDLHQQGFAHSVEAWKNNELVGGLYGVSIGAAFMGESMFHKTPEASKVCLVHLVEHLKVRHYELLDIQFMTDNLRRFGATEIPKSHFLKRLKKAIKKTCSFI